MKRENEKPADSAGADNGEAALPLFSAFRPKPRPAPAQPPAAAPAPKPAAPEKQPATTALEARLSELEKKLQEAAQRESARAPERAMLDYLKTQVGDLEEKLRDSQEKSLAFACELKGREKASQESRHKMEEVLTAIKQQQAVTEAERQQATDQKEFRGRLEALEQGLLEISSRPPAPPPADLSPRIEELAKSLETVSARLNSVENACKPADNAAELLELETKILCALEKKLDARLKREFSALEKSKTDFMGNAVTNMSHLLSGRLGEIREAIHYLASDAAAAGIEADRTVEWLRALVDRKGREAAGNIAGSYDLGFIQASLDNLEKCVSSAISDLDKAWENAQDASSLPAITPELRTRRHAEALRSAIDSLKDNLDAFREIRPGIVNNMRKRLTGG